MNKIMTANFAGTEMLAFHVGGIVVVALRPIAEGMGLDWPSQFKRVKRDPILSKGVVMMTIPFGPGGAQDHLCLRLDLVHGWLFRIDSNRVRPEIRDRVLMFQSECYDVLYKHFSGESEKLEHQKQESESLRTRMVSEARQTFGERSAQQLWRELGLPIVPAMAECLAQGDLFSRAA